MLEDAKAYMRTSGGKDSKARKAARVPLVDSDADYVQSRLEGLQVSDGGTRLDSNSLKALHSSGKAKASSSTMARVRFVIDEDMVNMLGRCCSDLNIPEPYYFRRVARCANGDSGVAVLASLRDLSLTRLGGAFADDGEAMQDATFKLMEKLLEAKGVAIRDYNYRVVQRLQTEIAELNRKLALPINERVRELELANSMMKAELEAFHEACS
ncbi:hypothetical protein PIB30_104739 [Stylosanthes scabra]|uniref:Uncharacterized protein n=1 Tax=Stylosanthes scabra TaxID=79078 RepID=A0ABU6TXY6_9FABA|nr:hypothetical protein [Stylosanthes scabra]